MRFRKALLRKLICTLIISAILAALSNCAFALDDGITVILNGERMVFTDAQPYIKDSRTLVPFRKIFEAFGMQVSWDGNKRQVLGKGNDTEILLTIDDTTAYVNNAKKILDVPAEITNSRTFVPLRFVSESVGADVQWNGGTKTVTINYGLKKEPEISKPGQDGRYQIGQTGEEYGFRFSISDVKINNRNVVVSGKFSDSKTRVLIYACETPYKSQIIEATILPVQDKYRLYSFEAETSIHYSDFKVNSIVIKTFDQNGSLVKVAEYKNN
ncbi:MAG TPA: copper amine oxidase N-terminal domain-containing protein [Clostridia bacterium]